MTAVEVSTLETLRTVLRIVDDALTAAVKAPTCRATKLKARQAVGLLLVGAAEVARILEGKKATCGR